MDLMGSLEVMSLTILLLTRGGEGAEELLAMDSDDRRLHFI